MGRSASAPGARRTRRRVDRRWGGEDYRARSRRRRWAVDPDCHGVRGVDSSSGATGGGYALDGRRARVPRVRFRTRFLPRAGEGETAAALPPPRHWSTGTRASADCTIVAHPASVTKRGSTRSLPAPTVPGRTVSGRRFGLAKQTPVACRLARLHSERATSLRQDSENGLPPNRVGACRAPAYGEDRGRAGSGNRGSDLERGERGSTQPRTAG